MLQRLQKDKFRFSEQKIEFNQDDVFGVRTDNKGKVVPILKWQTQCYNPADLNQPATRMGHQQLVKNQNFLE
jgi:hypothetical protein